MKKRRFLNVVIGIVISISSIVMAAPTKVLGGGESLYTEDNTISCHPGYITMAGNASSGSHSSHILENQQECDTIWFYDKVSSSCNKCNKTFVVEHSYTVHKNPSCSEY